MHSRIDICSILLNMNKIFEIILDYFELPVWQMAMQVRKANGSIDIQTICASRGSKLRRIRTPEFNLPAA